MDPLSSYNLLANLIHQGTVDFAIHTPNGKIFIIETGCKDCAQRQKDNTVLSTAYNILRDIPISNVDIELAALATKIVTYLVEEIGEQRQARKVISKILKASEILAGANNRPLLTKPQILTTDDPAVIIPKITPKTTLPKFCDIFSQEDNDNQSLSEQSNDEPEPLTPWLPLEPGRSESRNILSLSNPNLSIIKSISTPTTPSQPIPINTPAKDKISAQATSPRFQHQLQLSDEIFPSQEKLKKSPRPRSDSKKMKALEHKIEKYPYLGPDAFEKHVKKTMSVSLNDEKVPSSFGIDIFRYLSRNGIVLSSSLEKTFNLSQAESQEEHEIIAKRFVELLQFMIHSLPDESPDKVQNFCSQVEREFFPLKIYRGHSKELLDSSDLQKKMQDFAERNRQDKWPKELKLISKILQCFAQDAPHKIASFIMNIGTLHSIDLEKLPQEICLHFEESHHKLYVIYTTYFKDRDLTKITTTGDPIKFLVNSKMVFALNLKSLNPEWIFDRQTLNIGLPAKHKDKDAVIAETLYKTFFALGLEPAKCICPSKVPEKLSRT